MKRLFLLPLIALSVLVLSACTGYRANMEQGQDLTFQQVHSIHRGMTSLSVTDTLGSPVLENPYNPHRMIYVYTMLPAHGKPFRKQLILTMQHDRVTGISTQGY
jgi:outer membrane protein assembly factor BamE